MPGVDKNGEGLADVDDSYYPIFYFESLQQWLDLPIPTRKEDRVRWVVGEPGCGKSFASHYAETRYGRDGIYLVNAGVASGMSQADMLATLYPGGTFDDQTRPAQGRLRQHAELVLDYFGNLAMRTVGRQLLVVVDLDPGGSFWNDTWAFWRELALLCPVHNSLRLLLCGPTTTMQSELEMHEIGGIVCQEVDLRAVEHHCKALAEQLEMQEFADWATTRASELWRMERPGTQDVRYATCDAARIVMQVRRELIEKGESDV